MVSYCPYCVVYVGSLGYILPTTYRGTGKAAWSATVDSLGQSHSTNIIVIYSSARLGRWVHAISQPQPPGSTKHASSCRSRLTLLLLPLLLLQFNGSNMSCNIGHLLEHGSDEAPVVALCQKNDDRHIFLQQGSKQWPVVRPH